MYYPKFVNIEQAAKNLEGVAYNTMLTEIPIFLRNFMPILSLKEKIYKGYVLIKLEVHIIKYLL